MGPSRVGGASVPEVRNRPTRGGRYGRSGAARSGTRTGTGTGIGTPRRPCPLPLALPRSLPRVARSVLRVPGGRGVVDGELARRLDRGLRVGLVIAGCRPAPADPVPIAAHSSSWCGRSPQAVLGRPCLSSDVVRSETRSSDRRPSPYDADAPATGSGVAPDTSLITTRPAPAAPSSPQHPPIASQPALKCRISFPNPCIRHITSVNKSDRKRSEGALRYPRVIKAPA